MSWELFLDILLDALKDSVIVFAFVFFFHVVLSFIETPVANFLVKRKKTSPIFGALFGLVPQCGTSVIIADLYIKRFVTIGTVIAAFLSCSDEAILVLLGAWNERTIMLFPLIGLKLLSGVIVGLLVDLIIRKQKIEDIDHVEEKHVCEKHHHENTPLHAHFTHPLVHAAKIFAYVFVINLTLGIVIGLIGQENFNNFMTSNRYLAPLFASIIGLIPNCASSIFIAELFAEGSLSFGALFAGLLVNSGLGIMVLLKDKNTIKKALIILAVCFIVANIFGYLTCLVVGF